MFPPASAAILSLPEGFELRYDQRWRGLGASSTIRDAPVGDHVSGSLTVAARDAASGAIPAVARLR
jgi:hypothetical protein